MLQDKNQGVFVEDIIEGKNRFNENLPPAISRLLPDIGPQTANSANSKNSFRYVKLGKGGIPKPLTSQMYDHSGIRDNWGQKTNGSHRKANSTLNYEYQNNIQDQAARGFSQELNDFNNP